MKNKILCLLVLIALVVGLFPVGAAASTGLNSISLKLDYPEAGKLPAGTGTCIGSGFSIHGIDWYDREANRYLEPGDKIQANHAYKAEVWVEADDGYDFNCIDDNTPNVKAYVNGKEAEVIKAYEYKAWAMVVVQYYFEAVPPKGYLHRVDLNITAPVAGEYADFTQIVTSQYVSKNVYFNGETDENMKNGISWYKKSATSNYEQLPPNNAQFGEETAYGFHCLLFPEAGYAFTDETKVYVNGSPAEACRDYALFMSVQYQFPATGKKHIHSPSDWRATQVDHYKVCTTCGDLLETEAHVGGTATCTQRAICSLCGLEYGMEPDDHTWSPTFLYQDAKGHAWICARCKEHSEVMPHKPGPEATEKTPQVCTECGYVIAPIKNHIHELTKIPQAPATCVQEGNIEYYSCSGCKQLFADAAGANKLQQTQLSIGALGHTTSDTWEQDATYHWRICTVCKAVLEETKMLHEAKDGKCATCGYDADSGKQPQKEEPTAPPTVPVEKPADKDPGQQPQNMDWLLAAVIGLVCFGASVTATVIILKRKKK